MMKRMKQSEREKIYDAILVYLRDNKGARNIEAILRGTNEFYAERRDIMKELVHKELVDETEQVVSNGYILGNELTETTYHYTLSEDGKELLRKGGFRKKWWMNLLSNWERVLILFFMATSTFFALPYFATENTPIPDNKMTEQEEQSLSKSDTLELDSAHSKIDTTNK